MFFQSPQRKEEKEGLKKVLKEIMVRKLPKFVKGHKLTDSKKRTNHKKDKTKETCATTHHY